ncbi:MAG TPA: PilZ domain-containing protein [Candidatus Omnitrophota bacterium]|nr:PilZ domain-containing protein [Candidatus Omnitrophota bacterium]HPT07861.1 PilZ domain-containing protein [Candidatus Omnitrophota bacterium]
MGIEKRRFPRAAVNAVLEYVKYDRVERSLYITGAKNISEGGLCLITFERLEPGSEIELKFTLPEINQSIVAHAQVRWVKELAVEQASPLVVFQQGVQFVNISSKDRKTISEYVLSRQQ